HAQSVVVATSVHALRAALALSRIDEDAELPASDALLFQNRVVLVSHHPLRPDARPHRFVGNLFEALIESGLLAYLAQNCGVRTLRDAIHAAHTVLHDKLRDVRSDVAEIAQRACSGGNYAARHLVISVETFFRRAVIVCAYDALIEVGDID